MNLDINQLTLLLKGRTILHPLNTTIASGIIVGLVGRNGAGKSSFLRCVSGLTTTYNGNIFYNGQERTSGLVRDIGVLIDGNSLYSYLTAHQNLDIIRRYYNLPKDVIEDTLKLVGLSDASGKKVRYFSAGMKQRLSIAIACIHRPSLIILDEPLNTLDPEAVVGIRNLIKNINIQYGTTFIISSHSLEEVNKLFDQLLILKDGRMVLDASKERCDGFWLTQCAITTIDFKQVSTFAKDLNLLYQQDGEIFSVLGDAEPLAKLRSSFQSCNWKEYRKASIEEVYLFAHST